MSTARASASPDLAEAARVLSVDLAALAAIEQQAATQTGLDRDAAYTGAATQWEAIAGRARSLADIADRRARPVAVRATDAAQRQALDARRAALLDRVGAFSRIARAAKAHPGSTIAGIAAAGIGKGSYTPTDLDAFLSLGDEILVRLVQLAREWPDDLPAIHAAA